MFALLSIALLGAPDSPVLERGFVFDEPPTPACHASTIVATEAGLVAAWFGGTREGFPDVAVWTARRAPGAEAWSAPTVAADGVQHADLRYPCWNPVLFQPAEGPLLLFYKVGPTPRTWWGVLRTSDDGGETWSLGRRLPVDILGPIKNKPLELADGALLCGSSTENDGWRVHFERTPDRGRSWELVGPIHDGEHVAAIQPAFLDHGDGKLQALFRTRQGFVADAWSEDAGRTWTEPALTELENPNAGIDALTLADGRHLLVSNPVASGRTPLVASLSDDGRAWRQVLVLEDAPGEYSYPAVVQGADGRVHVTYTWKRERIAHVVLDPAKLE